MKKSFALREMPRVERPREKLIEKGPENPYMALVYVDSPFNLLKIQG